MNADEALGLYERYAADLGRAREEQRALYEARGYSRLQPLVPYRALRFAARRAGIDWERRRFMNPQLDDVEAELTYLRIRDLRPTSVVEIGPFRGWSTTWILRALRDNEGAAPGEGGEASGGGSGEGGGRATLTSFDLVDDALRFVPEDLRRDWRLVVGDVRGQLGSMPQRIDYLFVDADHKAPFARWYLAELMPRVRGGGSIHDVFHMPDPRRDGGEAAVVAEWLQGVSWMTASRLAPSAAAERIAATRRRLGFEPPIHFGDHDSMALFTLSG